MKIEVQYPTVETKYSTTYRVMRQLGYSMATAKYISKPINQEQAVQVNIYKKPANLDEMCLMQTGMTPQAYQRKYGVAWNE